MITLSVVYHFKLLYYFPPPGSEIKQVDAITASVLTPNK